MTAFLSAELAARWPCLYGSDIGYDDDPNGGGAPSEITGAPTGTLYHETTADSFWRKKLDSSWAEIDADSGLNSFAPFFYGAYLTDPIVDVTSDGANITLSLSSSGSVDTQILFSSGVLTLETDPTPATINLTAGTDSAPQVNYVYIPESTGALTVSSLGWPIGEFAAVATVLCQSASSAQTDGLYKVHAWTDHLKGSSGSHFQHVNEWIRSQNATWLSGGSFTVTIDAGPSPDNVYVSSTSGEAMQLHHHEFPAFDTQVSDHVYLVNDSVSPYTKVSNLNSVLTDSAGGSMSASRFSLVFWVVVSEDSQDCQLMCNLPSGTYGSDSAAIQDLEKYSVYTIPGAYKGTGILLARVTFRHQTAGGGQWTIVDEQDLRGLDPAIVGSGALALGAHAATHEVGGGDEVTIENLATTSSTAGEIVISNGLGGLEISSQHNLADDIVTITTSDAAERDPRVFLDSSGTSGILEIGSGVSTDSNPYGQVRTTANNTTASANITASSGFIAQGIIAAQLSGGNGLVTLTSINSVGQTASISASNGVITLTGAIDGIQFSGYANTRDDSSTTAVENMIYTDATGLVKSVPITKVVGIPARFDATSTDPDYGNHMVEYYVDPATGDDATGEPFSTVNKFETIQGCLDDIYVYGLDASDTTVVIYAPTGTSTIDERLLETHKHIREVIVLGDRGTNELVNFSGKAAKVKPAVGSLAATVAAAQVTATALSTYSTTSPNPYELGLMVNLGGGQLTEIRPEMRAVTDISSGTTIDIVENADSIPGYTSAYIVTYNTSIGEAGQLFRVVAPNVGTFRFVACKLVGTGYDCENTIFHGCRDASTVDSQTCTMRITGAGVGGFYAHAVGAEGSGADYKYTATENYGKEMTEDYCYFKRQRISHHNGKTYIRNNVWGDSSGLTDMSCGAGDFAKLFVERNDWYRCATHSLYAYRDSLIEILDENAVWGGSIFMRFGGGSIQISNSNLIYGDVNGATAAFIDAKANDSAFGGTGRGIKAGFTSDIENTTSATRQGFISTAHNASGFLISSLPENDFSLSDSTGTVLR